MAVPDEPAETYQPSGKARWDVLLSWFLLILVINVLMAVVLYGVFAVGLYIIGLAPVLAALPSLFALRGIVGLAHCRSPFLAGLLGVIAGLLLYLGSFCVGMSDASGFDGVVDLPNYINHRMHTDVQEDFPRRSGGHTVTSAPSLNWMTFGLELLFVCGVLAWGAGVRADRAYCETCGTWMTATTVTLPGYGANVWLRLRDGLFDDPSQVPPRDAKEDKQGTLVMLEHCANLHAPGSNCPAYVSFRVVELDSVGGKKHSLFEFSTGQTRIRRVRLGQAELAVLIRQLPALAPKTRAAGG